MPLNGREIPETPFKVSIIVLSIFPPANPTR